MDHDSISEPDPRTANRQGIYDAQLIDPDFDDFTFEPDPRWINQNDT